MGNKKNKENRTSTSNSVLYKYNFGQFATEKISNLKEKLNTPLTPDICRSYIAMAKEYEPYIPESLTDWLAVLYAEIRKEESKETSPTSYTTVRTLLSILRLSQAIAKLGLRNLVLP